MESNSMNWNNADYLRREYEVKGKTDRQIAKENNVVRSSVGHARLKHGIKTRKSTGDIGETLAIKKLESEGFVAVDMNEFSRSFPFDILVNNYLRVEVKTAREHIGKIGHDSFNFQLTDKPEKKHKITSFRITLANGRSKKLLRKTCDFVILVGIPKHGKPEFYVIPSKEIPDELQTLRIMTREDYEGKYKKYHNNWDLIRSL